MNLETVIISVLTGSVVSLVVLNLWGLRYIERALAKPFENKEEKDKQ